MAQPGRFERIRLLGSGTRTVTEKARVGAGASAGRVVTLVRLLPHAEADTAARETFLEKGRLLMRLQERAIVEALELGRSKTHYLARQFVDGVSVRRLLTRARERAIGVPLGFACDVVIQLCATLLALRRELRKAAPRLAQASFASTLRHLVVAPDTRVHWVDPFALDDPSLPRAAPGDPGGEELAALGALLYDLCVGRPAPRLGEFTEFALVAPSTFRAEIPRGIDLLCASALGFAEPRPHGVGAFADALAEAAAGLATPDAVWLRDLAGAAEAVSEPVRRIQEFPLETPAAPGVAARLPTPPKGMPRPPPPAALGLAATMPATLPPPPAAPGRAPSTPPRGLQPLSAISAQAAQAQAAQAQAAASGTRRTPPRALPARADSGSSPLGQGIVVRHDEQRIRVKTIALVCVAVTALGIVIARWALRAPTLASAAPERAAPRAAAPASRPTAMPEPVAVAPTAASAPLVTPMPRTEAAPARARPATAPPPAGSSRLEIEPPQLPEVAPPRAPLSRRAQRAAFAHNQPAPPPETRITPSAPRTPTNGPPPAPTEAARPAALLPPSTGPPHPAATPAARPAPPEPAPTPAPTAAPAPAAAPPPTTPRVVPYSAYIASRRVSGNEPRIPAALRSQLAQGSARARICVAADGRVNEVRILRSTTGLDEAIRSAVMTWRYRPFVSQGRPVPVCFEMPFELKRTQ